MCREGKKTCKNTDLRMISYFNGFQEKYAENALRTRFNGLIMEVALSVLLERLRKMATVKLVKVRKFF
jgi:hypothetical protein